MSEGQVKLASYILMVMTNRQIANMLGVEQSSVVKSRYRLRAKLKLNKETSLEDALRAIGQKCEQIHFK